jgi:hypothetical protein
MLSILVSSGSRKDFDANRENTIAAVTIVNAGRILPSFNAKAIHIAELRSSPPKITSVNVTAAYVIVRTMDSPNIDYSFL